MCHAVNEAIIRTLTEAVVSSTSLMVPCPWAPRAMRWLGAHPETAFGIHLTAVCDSRDYRWARWPPGERCAHRSMKLAIFVRASGYQS
ncbi:MAG: ChbG/HpnK family deacetylase [Chloroflexota bacterium]|nr:ChbG/HpnK family deacetylase [Chloroflexota bacterium]